MATKVKWVDQHIEVEPTKKPLKITGTRFAAIMGLNKWNTEFKTWCEVTKTYKEPFEDTIYTVAGKVIEPKQAEYMKQSYGMFNLVTPTEVFGEDYFKSMHGDFFHDVEVLGGMWDYLLMENGKPTTVLEMKTTKRAEDWKSGVPEYYSLQAALYAYLLGVDDVIMVASFLDNKDYENPDAFTPSASNTITVEFKVSEKYPDMKQKIDFALNWWKAYVVTGISPDYDPKADKDVMDALKTHSLAPDADIQSMLDEAEAIEMEIGVIREDIADKEARLTELKDLIKEHAIQQFRDGDEKVTMVGHNFDWTVSKIVTNRVDTKLLKSDGLYAKYCRPSEAYKLTMK